MKEICKCLICGKEVTNNNTYLGSHVKRIHNLSVFKYAEKYYKNKTPEFKIEKCGFCDNDAVPNMTLDNINYTYTLDYDNGYLCKTDNCINNISLLILNTPYNKKTYEHIGSNSKYLSLLYKKDLKEILFSKSKGFRETDWNCSLKCYTQKYGEDEGLKKYEERNKKISKANTFLWYLEKYGEDEGKRQYELFRKKSHKHLGRSKSKKSSEINKILDNFNIKYFDEYKYENEKQKNGKIDFYLPDYNIVIEYYGVYWHCNPNYYEKDYFNALSKRFAYEIWENDKNRINYIFEKEFKKNVTILIIWETTKFTPEYLFNLLNEIKDKNTIFEI